MNSMRIQAIEYRCKAETFARRKRIKYSYYFKNKSDINLSHITYYASNNVGDTVLSDTVRTGFEHFFDETLSWCLYDVSDRVSKKEIEKFNASSAIVIGGGGLFLPDTNRNSLSGWQWSYSPEQLEAITKPIVLFSVGYNYFRNQEVDNRFVSSLTDLVRKSSFVGLRNHGSIRTVQSLLSPEIAQKVVFQPCLTTLISKIGYVLPEKQKNNNIAINIAYDRIEARLGVHKKEILSSVAEAAKELERKGYNIFYIAHISKDLEFVNFLHEMNVKAKVVCASSWSSQKLINFYRNMDFVIGMRGHAQMIPFGVDTQILTLGSHDKMKWFLEDINAEDWYIELTEDPSSLKERIIDKFSTIHEKQNIESDERINDAKNFLYEETKKNFEIINKVITIK